MKNKTAAIAFGYGSQNIGNSFFQLGGVSLLRSVLGPDHVTMIQDVPAHWTLHRKGKGNPENWWNITSKVVADYVIFQGPSLNGHSMAAFDETFSRLGRRGVEPVLLGTGFMTYSDREVNQAKDLIRKHSIRVVSTRDKRTHALLGELATYDGIDSAFFVKQAFRPPELETDPYLAIAFESRAEPLSAIAGTMGISVDVRAGDPRWKVGFDRLSRESQSLAYALHRLRPSTSTKFMAGYELVRPVHRANPADFGRFFKDANSMVSDEPYSYLTLYANAHAVFTDRVHAVVAAIAYGRPAQLFSNTPRASLLERVGFDLSAPGLQTIDQAELEKERDAEVQYLSEVLNG